MSGDRPVSRRWYILGDGTIDIIVDIAVTDYRCSTIPRTLSMNARSFFPHVPALFGVIVSSLFLLPGLNVALADPDFEVEEDIVFTVKESRGAFTLRSEHTESYTYLNERSTRMTAFPIFQHFFVELSDITGTCGGRRVKKEDISFTFAEHEDVFISDAKIWWIDMGTASEGETARYSYTMKYEGAEWLPVQHVSNMGRLKRYRLTVDHPKDVDVDFSFFFPRAELPYTIEHPDEETTVLLIENVEEQEGLSYFPFNGSNGAVQIRLSRGGTAITPTTPKEFTTWYRGLYDQVPVIPEALAAAVEKELAGVSDERAKVKTIHDYVRGTIRYIAEEDDYGAIIPRHPELVLGRGYGDCKDRAYLVSALARRHGIDVDMTLVGTRPTPEFDNGVYISQFNHVICSWDDGDKRIYFDPTSKHTEFGNLPDSDIESIALVLDPENPKVLRLPRPNDKVAIEIDISGSLANLREGEARITLRNGYNTAVRYALDDLEGLDLENLLSNMLTSHFAKMSLDYFRQDTVGEDFISFTAQADLSEFLIASTAKRYIPSMPFSVFDAEMLTRADDPWPMTTPLQETILMRVHLQTDGFTADPKEVTIGDGDHASVSSSIGGTEEGGTLVTYRLWQASSLYEGDGKKNFLDFCRDYLKGKKTMFVLSPAGE